jgi:KDO2-lipid IV(A) lauroyltransferase
MLALLARLPLPALYGLSWLVYVLAFHVLRYRRALVHDSLVRCFPERTARQLRETAQRFYRNLGDVVVEAIRGHAIGADELRRRVRVVGGELLQERIARGQNVVLLAAHQCNWEWLLLACGAQLGVPVDAVYKPLHARDLDAFMTRTRSRFGGRPVPVMRFLAETFKRSGEARAFALVADQSPLESEEKYWTRFLKRDTAFYVGAEKIARLTRSPVLFVGMKRLRRGYYEVRFTPLAAPPYSGPLGAVIEPYARAVEAQILECPEDWLWTHRKWRYARPVYA